MQERRSLPEACIQSAHEAVTMTSCTHRGALPKADDHQNTYNTGSTSTFLTHQVAVKAVTVASHRHVEVHLGVCIIRLRLAQVPVNAAGTKDGAAAAKKVEQQHYIIISNSIILLSLQQHTVDNAERCDTMSTKWPTKATQQVPVNAAGTKDGATARRMGPLQQEIITTGVYNMRTADPAKCDESFVWSMAVGMQHGVAAEHKVHKAEECDRVNTR
jgi:hypothetical protein